MSQYNADLPLRPIAEPIRRGMRNLTQTDIREAMRMISQRGPRKVGDGPAAFPPVTSLERQPFRWDTNCFYRRLGLDPHATRLDIVRRFLDLDPRQDFIRLAIAAEVLLNKEKRSRYDALVIGTFWGDDPDLIDRRVTGELGAPDLGQWAVYADPRVTDEQARVFTSEWRTMLTAELAPKFAQFPQVPLVGIGVTPSIMTARWEQVGAFVILFVPLDAVPSQVYVRAAAEEASHVPLARGQTRKLECFFLLSNFRSRSPS